MSPAFPIKSTPGQVKGNHLNLIQSLTCNFLSQTIHPFFGTGHYLCEGGGGVGGKIMGWARPIFVRERGWAKREFHVGWGWVIVCFVKNHTHYNACGRSK